METWIVRLWDDDFVEKWVFDNADEAFKRADELIEVFGSAEVEVYKG